MTALSLVELMQIAYQIGTFWESRWSPKPMRFWFRGLADKSYSLNPGLLRNDLTIEKNRLLEYQISVDFKIRGLPFIGSAKSNPWDAMFLMQHYGFPTRLLDWTESLVVAAYFASRDIDSSTDGALWMLAPQWLIANQFEDTSSTHLYSGHDWVQPYRLCGPWDNEKFDELNAMTPMPILPDHLDQRIIVQRGRFTVHTFTPNSLENLLKIDAHEYGDAAFLQKIIVPNSAKPTIRQQCRLFGGVSEDTIFPDLEGLSRGMCWELKDKGILP